MKKNFMHLMTIVVGAMLSIVVVSCDDDKTENTDETKSENEFILGTWNFKNNYDEQISITFFDNGTYAHCNNQNDYGYEGFYKLMSDSVIFTIVNGGNYTYNRSVKIIDLSDDLFIFEGYDIQNNTNEIIYDGLYRGTKERNVDEKTSVKYRADFIGEWSVSYELYGTQIATLDIKDNGTFLFYDEDRYYKGTYSICDDKIMMLEDTQKCPIGGYLYTIKELTNNSFIFVDKYDDEIIGSK